MKRSFAQAWQDYRLLLCVGALYAVFCSWQAFALGISPKGYFGWVWQSTRQVVVITYIFVFCVTGCAFVREVWRADFRFGKAGAEFAKWLRDYITGPAFAGGCIGVICAYMALFFIIQKSSLRWVLPYAWDPDFARWDKLVHFGRFPQEYLMDWFAGPGFNSLMQLAYLGWFLFMYVGLGYALFCERDRLRKLQFVWVFLLSWALLGGFGATVLSSVGPVYYHHFYPDLPDVYKRLTDYMLANKNDIASVVYIQKKLLAWNYNFAVIVPNGISAMPSMHAAISTLVTLLAFGINRVVFAASLAFAVTVVVSSIYLGFHYAIDSYFSIIAVSFMWWASGRLLKRKVAATS